MQNEAGTLDNADTSTKIDPNVSGDANSITTSTRS